MSTTHVPTDFASLGVSPGLVAQLNERGITEPYPIQLATLPEALGGNDVCAQSPTGTGKTLAFGIPLIMRAGRGQPRKPAALVLAPTRELAAQISDELAQLGKVAQRTVATFYGGVGFKQQLSALRRGVDIAVGCPGRLIDLISQGAINLSHVEIVVIDEADRMADMGFLPDVRQLIAETREQRQTLLFSATMQGDVERLIRSSQRNPKRFVLDAPEDAVGSRTHAFLRVDNAHRASVLADIVTAHSSAIVFCRTKRGVDRLTQQLGHAGISAVQLHGDRTQAQRDRALAAFHGHRATVLVGTDVAARGIHVDNVGCVVHFDPPEDESTYLHRSGRTGRAGSVGSVFSLVTKEQERQVRKMQRELGMPLGFVHQDGTPHNSPSDLTPRGEPNRAKSASNGVRRSGPRTNQSRSNPQQERRGPHAAEQTSGQPRNRRRANNSSRRQSPQGQTSAGRSAR